MTITSDMAENIILGVLVSLGLLSFILTLLEKPEEHNQKQLKKNRKSPLKYC